MKQLLQESGSVVIEEVPVPQLTPGHVKIKVHYSAISAGTELVGLHGSGKSLIKRAVEQPQKIKKVMGTALEKGLLETYQMLERHTHQSLPCGYSCAGEVIEVAEDITEYKLGDKVAAAGSQCAFHAEIVCVPKNLVVKVPELISLEQAATLTLGAIAMQGVRQCEPSLGETVVVLGLGLLGQLTTQLLKANGCEVIGIDLDPARLELGKKMGLNYVLECADPAQVQQLTNSIGVDAVIITAATSSNEVISSAFQMTRKKGRVVIVGDVGLELKREDFYKKEIDLRISSSYGPGRYDPNYEEHGIDYPIAYVRWTENRNMQCYLELLARKQIDIGLLFKNNIYQIERADDAYRALQQKQALLAILQYPGTASNSITTVRANTKLGLTSSKIKLAIIGCGEFTQAVHLPNLKKLSNNFELKTVLTRQGHNAKKLAKQYGFQSATTCIEDILADKDIQAVLIGTRHHLHAKQVLSALEHGKHVFVEKPLATNREELSGIEAFYRDINLKELPLLQTGFNRRFSPYMRRIKQLLDRDAKGPIIMNYRMNAGYIPKDVWVHGKEGGGRNIGEACHIYDLFTYLTNSRVATVKVVNLKPTQDFYLSSDNFIVTLVFVNGSIACLAYNALGASSLPKEYLEVSYGNKTIVVNDYKLFEFYSGNKKKVEKTRIKDKGHYQELQEFSTAVLSKSLQEWPISLWQQLQAMDIAFEVEKQLSV